MQYVTHGLGRLASCAPGSVRYSPYIPRTCPVSLGRDSRACCKYVAAYSASHPRYRRVLRERLSWRSTVALDNCNRSCTWMLVNMCGAIGSPQVSWWQVASTAIILSQPFFALPDSGTIPKPRGLFDRSPHTCTAVVRRRRCTWWSGRPANDRSRSRGTSGEWRGPSRVWWWSLGCSLCQHRVSRNMVAKINVVGFGHRWGSFTSHWGRDSCDSCDSVSLHIQSHACVCVRDRAETRKSLSQLSQLSRFRRF